MAKDIWGVVRTVGLVVMIVGAVICEAILLLNHMWHWSIYWGCGVILGVGLIEIIAYIQTGKMISTQWRDWAKTKPLAAYGALGAMAIAFMGLIVHLAFWGGMFQKKDDNG
jgi:hypothetical protein